MTSTGSASPARIVVLDSGPLSLVTHPRGGKEAAEAKAWLWDVLAAGADVRIPEIADYEQRRELLRAGRTKSVERLEALEQGLDYIALTTAVMRRAAELWAHLRNAGLSTAPPEALDADMILAAQTLTVAEREDVGVVIATTNPGHLDRVVAARHWREIAVQERG